MKPHLLFADRDISAETTPSLSSTASIADLDLRTLFAAMSAGDAIVASVLPKVIMQSLTDVAAIEYRQCALKDCIDREDVVRAIFALADSVVEGAHKGFFSLGRSPSSLLYRCSGLLQFLAKSLRSLRAIADDHLNDFTSEAFRTLFTMLHAELADDYLSSVERYLYEMSFRSGLEMSAHLGEGNKAGDYVLRGPARTDGGWFARWFDTADRNRYTFHIHERDEAGLRALSELRDRGLNLVANAISQSCDHLVSFFFVLRAELAFYVGCLNLLVRLRELDVPICFPQVRAAEDDVFQIKKLYDPCLVLNTGSSVVTNTVDAGGKDLAIITGANQGGKSTFLRSVGLFYLMMQCGMFVSASSAQASLCTGLFTHYRREEDAAMTSGKLDEELHRLSDIIDTVGPHTVMLFNESFSSTNEREGAEVARQIVTALLEAKVRVFFVSHQYEFARAYFGKPDVLFLRAERLDDGTRTFKLVEAAPERTSYGADVYRVIFGEASSSA
ncbi:MAG TPA: hypothetical protein VGF98_05405 [Candidatus Tumulicola sp.]